MGGWLAPAFLAGLLAAAIPVLIHMIHRERRETVAFPSLMFLRKIPYRSVRRQKLRHLLLLAMRCLALAFIAAAFARPFLRRSIAAPTALNDSRELVILLDRSYSMGHGQRWDRAVAAARTLAREIRPNDRVTLVTFGAGAAQANAPASSGAPVEQVLATLRPGSEPTRITAGLRMAAQLLSASQFPRREIVLISDFHRYGWTPNDDVALPEHASIRTVDVSRAEHDDVAVAGVAIARNKTGDRVAAVVTARIANLGSSARTVDVALELAGRTVESRRTPVAPRSTAQVILHPAPVAATTARGTVRVSADEQPANDAFFFTVGADAGASALIVEPPPSLARSNQSLFLARAWSVADDPAVAVDRKTLTGVASTDVRSRSLIVLNEVDLPSEPVASALLARIRMGAFLIVAPGEHGVAGGTPELRAALPATVGATVDRTDGGARWSSWDGTNGLFEPFRGGRADFSSASLSRYRTLTPLDSARVIARLDDGAPLLIERSLAAGKVFLWATSLDANWTDLPFHPLWVPLLHQIARRSIVGGEQRAWFTAPATLTVADKSIGVAQSPSGERIRLDADDRRVVDLREAGFYELRATRTALGAGQPVAVNVDLGESDLSHFDPAELVASVTARAGAGGGGAASQLSSTPAQDLERQQRVWWYLLVGGLLLLAAETLLSNRLSRGFVRA